MTNATKPDWHAADKAYLAHHGGCAQCKAAGIAPNRHERCTEGAALWATYEQAGDPPHFTWLQIERMRRERLQQRQQHRGYR